MGGIRERERKQRGSLNGPAIPLVPSAAVQTRLSMTKTSSSAAGVSLSLPQANRHTPTGGNKGGGRIGGKERKEKSVCWGKR